MRRRLVAVGTGLFLAATLAHAANLVPISAEQAVKLDIRTANPQPAEAVPLLSASARVVVPPGREFMVSATHAGMVSRIDVAVGDTAAQGQVLAELVSPAFLALQREALQAAHEHRLADSLLARDQKLLSEGAIPKRRWEETRTLHDKNSAGDSEVRQVLAIAGMTGAEVEQLMKTQKLTDRLEIKAPVSGMVLERLVTTGGRVDQLAPLFRVADVSRLWLEIDLPPEQVNKIAEGDLVRVQGLDVGARIGSVGRQVLTATHSVVARAEVDNGAHELFPGQTVGVDILRAGGGTNPPGPPYQGGKGPAEPNPSGSPLTRGAGGVNSAQSEDPKAIWRVPAAALAHQAGASYVFVKRSQGFEPRTVESLGQSGGDLVLRGQLTAEDEVAVQGVAAIKAKWAESEGHE